MCFSLLIDFVEADATDEPQWKGILYAIVLFLSAFTATLFLAQATHRFYIAGMRARTALVSAIYRKSLLLSNAAKRGNFNFNYCVYGFKSSGELLFPLNLDLHGNYKGGFVSSI